MSQYHDDMPKVDEQIFTGLLWGGVTTSFSFLLFRLFVRIRVFRKIFADDVLVGLAWSLLLVSAVLWSIEKDGLHLQLAVHDNITALTPDVSKRIRTFNWSVVAFEIMFFTCLWTIKLSFLIFLRRLGEKATGWKLVWWLVTALVVASFITCISVLPYRCLVPPLEVLNETCPPEYANKTRQTNLHYTSAIDVITDAAVISVPVKLLWNVHINWRKKLALAGLFSLSLIVIAFTIVRVSIVGSYNEVTDNLWLFCWSSLEMSLAIVVACLASFRQLFTKPESRPYRYSVDDTTSSCFLSLFKLLSAFIRKKKPVAITSVSATSLQYPRMPTSLADPQSLTYSTGLKNPRDAEETINDESKGLQEDWRHLASRSLPETFSELSLDFDSITLIPVIDSGHRGTLREKLEHVDRSV